jgi:hypothetical protein
MGMIMIWYGSKYLSTEKEDMDIKKGIVQSISMNNNTVFIKLKNRDVKFHTSIPKQVEIILNKLNEGEEVVIYIMKGKNEINYIESLEKDDKVLIEYEKAPLIPLMFLIIGIVITCACIIYLKNNLEDLFGGDKSKMKKLLDPWRKYKN